MLWVNKLINLVFNAKKINAKTQFASFFLFLFLFLFYFEKKKQKNSPRMKCMNVMQCKS